MAGGGVAPFYLIFLALPSRVPRKDTVELGMPPLQLSSQTYEMGTLGHSSQAENAGIPSLGHSQRSPTLLDSCWFLSHF